VAGRLEPQEAARYCTQAAGALTQALTKTTDPGGLIHLAWGLGTVAGRLEPQEAARYCTQAAGALTQALTKTTDPVDPIHLAQALPVMAGRLEPQEAAQAASALIRAMSQTPRYFLPLMAKGLAATLTAGAPTLPVRAAGLVGGVVASNQQPLLGPAALLLALAPPSCRLSTEKLVDLLKHPLCVDQARRVVLKQVENRYRSRFADHWEFVNFARAQNLGLDFTTPPRHPDAPTLEKRK
jgi:hypothetical protein